jgi:hypothetical protein
MSKYVPPHKRVVGGIGGGGEPQQEVIPEREALQLKVERARRVRSAADLAALHCNGGSGGGGAASDASLLAEATAPEFFDRVLPRMVDRAAALREHFPTGLRLLPGGSEGFVTMPRVAAASLLCAMFINAVPPTLHMGDHSFARLFGGPHGRFSKNARGSNVAKLQLFIHYFEQLVDGGDVAGGGGGGGGGAMPIDVGRFPPGDLTVRRAVLAAAALPAAALMQTLEVHREGGMSSIEGALTVCFSNKRVGGGTLGNGALQEEVRFATAPEHLIATLLCPEMGDGEAVLVTGAAAFGAVEGYHETLKFHGRAPGGQSLTTLCIDALDFSDVPEQDRLKAQLTLEALQREVFKVFAGAGAVGEELPRRDAPLSTGRWGCGSHGGHDHVKALVQWIAASAAGRPLNFFLPTSSKTYDALVHDLEAAVKLASESAHKLTVGAMWTALCEKGTALTGSDDTSLVTNIVRAALESAPQAAP